MKLECMRDRKLVGSRQRSLSSRFILPRRKRPLLAGKSQLFRLQSLYPKDIWFDYDAKKFKDDFDRFIVNVTVTCYVKKREGVKVVESNTFGLSLKFIGFPLEICSLCFIPARLL